jgi:hypothetical protein
MDELLSKVGDFAGLAAFLFSWGAQMSGYVSRRNGNVLMGTAALLMLYPVWIYDRGLAVLLASVGSLGLIGIVAWANWDRIPYRIRIVRRTEPVAALVAVDTKDRCRESQSTEVWREADELELYVIACRSVGVEPTYPVPDPSDALWRLRTLGNAIRTGDLKVRRGDIDNTGGHNGHMVQIHHQDLRDYGVQQNVPFAREFAELWKPRGEVARDFALTYAYAGPHQNKRLILTALRPLSDVVVLARFALVTHDATGAAEWKWALPAKLIDEPRLSEGEAREAKLFERERTDANPDDVISICGKSLRWTQHDDPEQGKMVLIEVRRSGGQVLVREILNFRRCGKRQFIDSLAEHDFIKDRDALMSKED